MSSNSGGSSSGLEHWQQPDRLVGVVKLGCHLRFVHAQTEKIGQY